MYPQWNIHQEQLDKGSIKDILYTAALFALILTTVLPKISELIQRLFWFRSLQPEA